MATAENDSPVGFDAVEESLATIRLLSECLINGIGNLSENAPNSKSEREIKSIEAANALREVFDRTLSVIDKLPIDSYDPNSSEYQILLSNAVASHAEAASDLQQEISRGVEIQKDVVSNLQNAVKIQYSNSGNGE